MSRTPEVIIVAWRKFLHDAFAILATVAFALALFSMLASANFVPFLLAAVLFAYVSSRIKFKLVKQIEVGGFKLV